MLTDSQYNAISRIYDARRSDAMHLRDERINELYNAVPEIKEIDVNWCAGLGTVLANEEVIINKNGEIIDLKLHEDGESDKYLHQHERWDFLRVSDYSNGFVVVKHLK